MTAAAAGFALGLSLILAIGAQNAFVLRQGLRGAHVFWVSFTCALSDAALITAGVSSFTVLSELLPGLVPAMKWAGAAFLFAYGALSFRNALRSSDALMPTERATESLRRAVLTSLALTWLNPHVYLDTVLLLGSISTQYPGLQWAFGAGAVTSSFVFFFSLGYGAALLRPLFAKPVAWRVLEVLIGLTMWAIAVKLLLI
ncbi:MAG: LysE/ArgO family amino acid transporter [Pseudomonadota bacterium]